MTYSSFRRRPESIERLNRARTWAPAYAGVAVKDSHILQLDIDTPHSQEGCALIFCGGSGATSKQEWFAPGVFGLGPVPSTNKALKHAGLTMDQIDRVEFNEAFAAQIIPSALELGIPMEKLNVNGGALAIGHPLGATGGRLVLTLAHELRRPGAPAGSGRAS